MKPQLPRVVLVGGPDVDARLELMRHLARDFDVSALGSMPSLCDRFSAEGFEYGAYHLDRRVNPFADIVTVCQLVAKLRRLRPHVVHAFDTKPDVWACLAARLAGVPVIIGTITGIGPGCGNGKTLKSKIVSSAYLRLQSLACRVSDATIFQNHDDARTFVGSKVVSQEKAEIILGSGVATDRFVRPRVSNQQREQARVDLDIRPDETVITMISRVIRSKGVMEFMAAATKLRSKYPRARFLLVGPHDQDSMDSLTDAELMDLKRSVTWPGPRTDIPTILSLSDIFVLPSAYPEGIPRVLLEAASMGLPLVATASPGCTEVVEDSVNGYLVPVRDAQSLSRAIARLIEQPALRQQFGRASRARAVEHFDISVIASQTREVYQRLLSEKDEGSSKTRHAADLSWQETCVQVRDNS